MEKVYLVKNESGNESTVTESMYKYLSGKKGYECRIVEREAPKEISDPDGGSKDPEKTEAPKADNDFESLPEDTEFPYHYGGGNFYLSDGTKVRGEDNAIEAEEAL